MLRLRSLLPALFLTAVGLDAHADALRDIRDIRSGSTPIRHELLGYTDRHEFVFRSLICGNDEMATCRAEITTVHPNADPVTSTSRAAVTTAASKGRLMQTSSSG